MLQRKFDALFSGKESSSINYVWVNYGDFSKQMPLAVIAAEDQTFPFHFGFDLQQIQKAVKDKIKGKRLRGASTITQQVAKNLFLWEGRDFVRKTLEAYFAILIESLWSKKRILEVYLNIAETGDMLFGFGSASSKYFNIRANKISLQQAALLAAVLPSPKKYSVVNPSEYVLKRKQWIINQMKSLGGISYLKNI